MLAAGAALKIRVRGNATLFSCVIALLVDHVALAAMSSPNPLVEE